MMRGTNRMEMHLYRRFFKYAIFHVNNKLFFQLVPNFTNGNKNVEQWNIMIHSLKILQATANTYFYYGRRDFCLLYLRLYKSPSII